MDKPLTVGVLYRPPSGSDNDSLNEFEKLVKKLPDKNVLLLGLRISHLAWADDLVVLSLDPESLQKQIDILEKYCSDWGLEVNIAKTKFMVLNGKASCLSS
ncbi:hypothetical protein ACHWQZ_G000965 [Mnemiopsis leidyi]